jgi:hypothetical protein
LLSLFVASTMTSSSNSMHASEMPFCTRSRAAAAAAAIVGKDETATVVGSAGASLSVAAQGELRESRRQEGEQGQSHLL